MIDLKFEFSNLKSRGVTRRDFLRSAVAAGAVINALPNGGARAADDGGWTFTSDSRRLLTGWEYRRGNLGGIWEAWRKAADDTVRWQPVELPHCFNAFDAVDPDEPYYQGPGWYRARLKVENPYTNGRTLLHFEGAGQKTEVYVSNARVGAHVGGYDEFTVDITEEAGRALKVAENKGLVPVAVMCDNSRDLEMIPSNLSDFALYGGLYRYVNLVYVPALSVERVHVETSVPPEGHPKVSVRARLHDPTRYKGQVKLTVRLFGPGGRGELLYTNVVNTAPWEGERELAAFEVEQPSLWSTRRPWLYRCEVRLEGAGGTQYVSERFGLRSFEFVGQGPFKLNGERLLLRGTHRHEDHAGLGAALTEELMRKEFALMKEMGVNFIRLGHYQQSRVALELCDELGFLVWEEIPWCRGGLGGERYKEQARRMLRNMIDQHRNHPSVIIWGLGNENDWPGDFEEFDREKIRAFMKELHDLSHALDPSRKTAIRRCDFCKDIVNVYSPSIWAGWYRGRYTEYKKFSEDEMKKVRHFLHVEYGGDSHAGRHSEEVERVLSKFASGQAPDERGLEYLLTGGVSRASSDGDWSETYVCNLFDWHLKEQETMPWLTGAAQWVFKDFCTPLRPSNPVPRVNQKGLVERDLTVKEAYYVFQSYWADKPMLHLYGHKWPFRWGEKNEAKLVKVYSNCSRVELFVNGTSAGVRRRDSQDFPAAGLRWLVPFREGENHLQAVGRKDGATVTDEIEFAYETRKWGKPARLVCETLGRSGGVAVVGVRLFDAAGVPCLDARNVVRFGLTGDGRLLDNLGTNTGSRKVELSNGRARIGVKLAGPAVVSVSSEGVPTAFLTLES